MYSVDCREMGIKMIRAFGCKSALVWIPLRLTQDGSKKIQDVGIARHGNLMAVTGQRKEVV